MELEELELAIRKSWDKNTCWLPSAKYWPSYTDPASGQCGVTALVVQDYFGGNILYSTQKSHFANELPDGRVIDFTRSQFPEETEICFDKVFSRNYLLEDPHSIKYKRLEAYNLLKERVETFLNEKKCPTTS